MITIEDVYKGRLRDMCSTSTRVGVPSSVLLSLLDNTIMTVPLDEVGIRPSEGLEMIKKELLRDSGGRDRTVVVEEIRGGEVLTTYYTMDVLSENGTIIWYHGSRGEDPVAILTVPTKSYDSLEVLVNHIFEVEKITTEVGGFLRINNLTQMFEQDIKSIIRSTVSASTPVDVDKSSRRFHTKEDSEFSLDISVDYEVNSGSAKVSMSASPSGLMNKYEDVIPLSDTYTSHEVDMNGVISDITSACYKYFRNTTLIHKVSQNLGMTVYGKSIEED